MRLSIRPKPRVYEISADYFSALNEHLDDGDFPERELRYRETLTDNGYPACVEVERQYQGRKTCPIGNTILTCHRDVNLLIRGQHQYIMPGKYQVLWLVWFVGGRKCFASHESPSRCFIPEHPQLNLVSERFFPSMIPGEEPPKLDSGFFYPWNFRFSAGRPQNYSEFFDIGVNIREQPLLAPCLLMPGFQEIVPDYGSWNTMKNSGWYEMKGTTAELGNDGKAAFVMGRKWTQNWTGGFSFVGVKLVPVSPN